MSNVLAIVEACCIELHAAYSLPIERTTDVRDAPPPETCAILGFTGDLRGAAILATSRRCVAATDPVGSGDVWLGELVNQLVGRIKNTLLRHGVEISLSTPVILRGERLAPVGKAVDLPAMFRSDAGLIYLWFDFEARPGLEWQEAAQEEHSTEGDAFFF